MEVSWQGVELGLKSHGLNNPFVGDNQNIRQFRQFISISYVIIIMQI